MRAWAIFGQLFSCFVFADPHKVKLHITIGTSLKADLGKQKLQYNCRIGSIPKHICGINLGTNFQVHLNVFSFHFLGQTGKNWKRHKLFVDCMSTLLRRQRREQNTNLWHSFNNVWILGCIVFLISAVDVNFSILKHMDLRTKELQCSFYLFISIAFENRLHLPPPLNTCYGQAKCEWNPRDVEQV